MELFTPIAFAKPEYTFSHRDRIVLLGSCFAENIGKRLEENKFRVDVNPFGTLYNPASVALALRTLIRPESYTAKDLVRHEGAYHSFLHHSRFSALSEEEVLENINSRLQVAAEGMEKATRLIVTWGTSYVYRLKSNGQVVANCHKFPEKLFDCERLSVEEIVDEWKELLYSLWEHNPKVKLLFTVSPIRHWKDGAHGNQLSKATLLLAVDRLAQLFPGQITYFPAYEIMMDELRDYRYYADDMLHPSTLAIDYIWERFTGNCLSDEARQVLKEWNEILKAINHRAFQPESEAYRRFINQTLLKLEQLHSKLPYFDVQKEKNLLLEKL